MPGLRPDIDPDGLLEYSVVYTDRARNHMSEGFQEVMNDVSRALRRVYGADTVAIVPGSGTFAMEAVARQFATDQDCVVIRNGWFSYRWSQIFDVGSIPRSHQVCKARPVHDGHQAPYVPAPVDEVADAIRATRPAVVFAPHVETASGIILPDHYIAAVAEATHAQGGLFVLDCIASGTIWVDMRELGVDVLISAPQKGWSASPFGGLVMMNSAADTRLATTTSTSFACDLARWRQIMESYEQGGHAYHATMPTDAIAHFRDVVAESEEIGLRVLEAAQRELGDRVRTALAARGHPSVAADGYGAPGVVVSYTDDPEIHNGAKFAAAGLQIAGGVPLMCDEPDDYRTFRLGLFGLDKLIDVDGTVSRLERALDTIA